MKISPEDAAELTKLYQRARTTPALLIGNTNTATDAWDKVREKMDELGVKYGFNPKTIKGIMPDGEVKE